jgi:hypothetical protein
MLTRDNSFTVISIVLSVMSLVISIGTVVFAFSGYSQASLNTTGINAQIRAQRTMLAASLATSMATATPHVEGVAAAPAATAAPTDAVRRALQSLQQYKLPEDP